MQEEPFESDKHDQQPARSRLRRILRWVPAATIVLVVTLCWGVVLRGGMEGVAAWYLLMSPVPLLGLFFLATVLVYAIWKRRFSRPMFATLMMSLFALGSAAWPLGLMSITYPTSIDSTAPSTTVRLPADVPLKVAWGGDNVAVNMHAATPDQRWAYDLLVESYLTGSENLEDYGCYGIPVVAPVTGRVAIAHDGEPDMKPGRSSMNFKAPLGNHVVIELATKTYLIIAHLKPNSVTVVAGQEVEEGQVIGQCGNSGNTSEPHIHIHHQRQDPAVFPVLFAEGLPLYFRDHDGPPMPEGGLKEEDGQIIATGMVVQHRGKNELRTQGQ